MALSVTLVIALLSVVAYVVYPRAEVLRSAMLETTPIEESTNEAAAQEAYVKVDAPNAPALAGAGGVIGKALSDGTGADVSAAARTLFVGPNGRDEGSGLAPEEALATVQVAVDRARAGDTVLVAPGNYFGQTVEISASGTPDRPIRLSGYGETPWTTPGIASFDHASTMDPTLMPLLDGGDRAGDTTAIRVSGDHVIVTGFQIRNYTNGLYVAGADHGHFENVYVDDVGDPNFDAPRHDRYNGVGIKLSGGSDHNVLRNSVVVNSTGEGIVLGGTGNLAEYNAVYADDNSTGIGSATDYYFYLFEAFDTIVRHNYIERVGELEHLGHGFTALYESQNNLFEHNTAVNIMNGGFAVRYAEAAYNTFRHNTIEGGFGILARDGAHSNVFEDMTINNAHFGIWMFDSAADELNEGHASRDNVFRRIKISNSKVAIAFHDSYRNDPLSSGNVFEQLEIDGAEYLFRIDHRTRGNVLRDSVVRNVSSFAEEEGYSAGELDVRVENTELLSSDFRLFPERP